jgi:HTH-type transcriptional regulator / antitoxin HipB
MAADHRTKIADMHDPADQSGADSTDRHDPQWAIVMSSQHLQHGIAASVRLIGSEVRKARRQLGMDQREVALVANVSPRTVHAVEAGKLTIRLDVLMRVLQAVGLELALRSHPRQAGAQEQ